VTGRLQRIPTRAATITRRLGAVARERQVRERLIRLSPPRPDARTISLVVVSREGRDRLARLLPALWRTLRPGVEILVVDVGGDRPTRRLLSGQRDVELVEVPGDLPPAAAANAGAERAGGDLLCLLDDELEPITPRWLERMRAELTGDVGVVGAQLLHPRQALLSGSRRDLTVQHRGITFVPVPGEVPRAEHVRGPRPALGGAVVEVAAVSGAALLLERRTWAELGGLDEGYVHGAADVDLCWRVRATGRRVVVVDDVVLLHHGRAARRLDEAAARTGVQARDWRRFSALHGAEVTRAVTLDRLTGRRALSRVAYRAVVLPAPGTGAHGGADRLARALRGLGWQASVPAGRAVPVAADLVVVAGPGLDPAPLRRPGRAVAAWLPGGGADAAGAAGRDWDVTVAAPDPTVAAAVLRDALVAGDADSRFQTTGRLRPD